MVESNSSVLWVCLKYQQLAIRLTVYNVQLLHFAVSFKISSCHCSTLLLACLEGKQIAPPIIADVSWVKFKVIWALQINTPQNASVWNLPNIIGIWMLQNIPNDIQVDFYIGFFFKYFIIVK